jgi:uncharacterized membrane protein HdeD (DUF308 family)
MNQAAGKLGTDLSWGWVGITGALLMILGAAVVAASTFATLALSWLLGLGLIVGGLMQLFHTRRFGELSHPAIQFLVGALSLVAGVLVLRSPLVGAEGITLVIAFYLLFGGVTKSVFALEGSGMPGRGGVIFSAVISAVLGLGLLAIFPISSIIVPGALVGVDFFFYGISLIVVASHLRRAGASTGTYKLRRVA